MRAFSTLVIAMAITSFLPPLQGDEPPPAVKEVLQQFAEEKAEIQKQANVKIQAIREKAIQQLRVIQDRYCKEGKLDEALAVREKIRELNMLLGNNPRPDPGYINAKATDIGQVWYFKVTGKKTGTVYGAHIYTTGSDLGTAAVHTGVLRDGQTGVVKVTILPGQADYPQSTQHGITSQPYTNWHVSFKVEETTALKKEDATEIRKDPGALQAFRGMNGNSFLFEVTGATSGSIWGTEVYTDDSSLATAAVHAGILKPKERGLVRVTILKGQSGYKGSMQNDIQSHSWKGWVGSFKMERVKRTVKE